MNDISSIILENERLIYSVIKRYQSYFELEDLYQVAAIGLIEASKNYKVEYNTKFTTYAYPYIIGEVSKYINSSRSIKVSRKNKILYLKILKAKELLSQQLMKVPSLHELSQFLEIDEQIIENTIIINSKVNSLDQMVSNSDKSMELYDTIGYYDKNIESYHIKEAINSLMPEEKQIIESRFYEELSQREVGEYLGIHQVEVSRKEKKILQKLRDSIGNWK